MFAVAAAHATLPAKIKGTFHLDWYDVRIIQCRAAILKLREVVRVLKILEKNLDKTQEVEKCIIPLVNYMLSLCEGPCFNVHPALRKRFLLLCELKLCKKAAVDPQTVAAIIGYDVELSDVVADLQNLRESIYNASLQWKLLECLQTISQNAIEIYEKRMKQVQIERTANRPADVPGGFIPFDMDTVEDIMEPTEISLCLDWAVLINDRGQDTSLKSLRKLQTQVLTKFLANLNEKALPVLRIYFNQLQKCSTSKGPATATIKELPHWEYTIHRMYAYIYRTLCLLDVIVSISRQIYLPNKTYFYSLRSQLSSENVFAYREVLNKIDSLCADPKGEVTANVLAHLDSCSNPKVNICVAFNTVADVFQTAICQVTPILRNTMQLVTLWLEMWKFVDNNSDSAEKLANLDDRQLESMVEERLAVDKLNQVEKQNDANRLTPEANGTGGRGSSIRRNIGRKLSAPTSPAITSNGASPGKVSPLRISRTSSRTSSIEKSSRRSSNLSSPQISRRSSFADIRISTPGVQVSSPQLSRRSSFAENRQPYSGSILMKNSMDSKNSSRSSLSNKAPVGRPRSSSLQLGRPRSSSLQSVHAKSKKGNSDVDLLSRSNSLQSSAIVSQKAVQDTFSQLVKTRSTNCPPAEKSDKKLPSSTRKLRVQTSNGNPPRAGRLGYKIASETSPLPETAQVILSFSEGSPETEQENKGKGVRSAASGQQRAQQPQKSTQCQEPQQLQQQLGDQATPSELPDDTCIKKVRFAGVGPMKQDELPKPKKKGWYKKPAVLHYPPPPPQYLCQKFRMRQEGIAFRSSLREETNQDSGKKNSVVTSVEDTPPTPPKESVSQRFTAKLREKLK